MLFYRDSDAVELIFSAGSLEAAASPSRQLVMIAEYETSPEVMSDMQVGGL
jgi:hypothetical protein